MVTQLHLQVNVKDDFVKEMYVISSYIHDRYIDFI